jgi:hypothetical protein
MPNRSRKLADILKSKGVLYPVFFSVLSSGIYLFGQATVRVGGWLQRKQISHLTGLPETVGSQVVAIALFGAFVGLIPALVVHFQGRRRILRNDKSSQTKG